MVHLNLIEISATLRWNKYWPKLTIN